MTSSSSAVLDVATAGIEDSERRPVIYLQPGDQVCYLGEWLDVVRTQRDAAGNRMLVWVDEVVGENAWGPVYKVLFFTAVAPDGGPVLVRSIGGRLT